jgi:pilus assembly protein CpaB
MMLAIASRPNDMHTTLTVGADVSRFQRRTVPAKPPVQGAGAAGAKPEGPSVRVARGNTIEFVPVGGK